MVDTAATVGSTAWRTCSHISTGNVRNRADVMKIAITTSSHDVMNEKIAPVRTPGRMIGNVMCRKLRRGSAPRLAAASSRLRSIVRNDVATATTTNGRASAVWATTRPTSDPAMRHCTNSPNMPIAMTTTGTMSGESTSALTAVRPRNRPRVRPSAASVPSTVARIAVRSATWKLLARPVDHCRSVTMRSYQASVNPSGGKLRIRASVKLIGTITSVGASR